MLPVIIFQFPFLKKKEIWFYNNQEIDELSYNVYCYCHSEFNKNFDIVLKEFTSIITQNSQTVNKRPLKLLIKQSLGVSFVSPKR